MLPGVFNVNVRESGSGNLRTYLGNTGLDTEQEGATKHVWQ